MTGRAALAAAPAAPATAAAPPVLRRQCACGSHASGGATCSACAEDEKVLRRQAVAGGQALTSTSSVSAVLRSPGRPLDAAARSFMEPRFGRDFAHVRVHTDAQAARSARSLNALAYTLGHDVVFAAAQYAPDTDAGRRLLAHELAHTLQQPSRVSPASSFAIGDACDPIEHEADRIADAVISGEPLAGLAITSASGVRRQVADPSANAEEASGSAFGAYHGCGGYREQLEQARAEAARLAGRASALLEPPQLSQAAPLLAAHFHLDPTSESSRADLQSIREQFSRMQQALSSSIRIFCRGAPAPGGARSALPVDTACRSSGSSLHLAHSTSCAAGDATATVVLCEVTLLGMGSPLVKTLLHEFAHIACNGTPRIRSGGLAGAEVYYEGDRLPGTAPNELVNADSYAWFALQADAALGPAGAATTSTRAGTDRTDMAVITALGAAATIAGAVGLGLSAASGNDVGIGFGIAGLGAGAVGLGVGIAGLSGAFDARPQTPPNGQPSQPEPRVAPRTLPELSRLSAWELASLPESAFAAVAPAAERASGAQLQDYARAWRLVRCVRDFNHLTIDPLSAGQLGRDPSGAEWSVLRQTLSQILAQPGVNDLVQGPGGRGEVGSPALANKVRIVSRLEWGIKRFQLERLVMGVGGGADRLVRQWWEEARCGISAGPSPQIVEQERQMAALHEAVVQSGVGSGGFYFPPDDTIYLGESMAAMLTGSDPERTSATRIAGHEMVHLLGGRERTRQAFMSYFEGAQWICYWSAFEEGMAEITARDALSGGQAGADDGYSQSVALMREVMQALGEDHVRRAYFTGSPDRALFERLREGLPSHRDRELPPVCRAAADSGGAP